MTRTSEPLPLIVGPGETLKLDRLEDDATDRPAVIVRGGTVEIGVALRQPTGIHARDTDPGIGRWFPGTKRDVSKHDVARAMIVAVGSCKIKVNSLTSDVGILAIAEDDGTYGVGSSYSVGYSKCGFGVMLSGQKSPVVKVSTAVQLLYAQGPARHVVYGNISRLNGVQLGLRNPNITIGKVGHKAIDPNVRFDHVTLKLKSAWDVRYSCLMDRNPCGAMDLFDCSGFFDVGWVHPGGDAQNNVFTAFRVTSHPENPEANGKACVFGAFDCALAPDQAIPAFMWQTAKASFATCRVNRGGAGNVYWFADPYGVAQVLEIGK